MLPAMLDPPHLASPHFIGKRSAEPHGTGVALHPGHATSYVGPTTFGLPHFIGKRSAEPGVAFHPGQATSYVGPTTFGLPHGYPAPHFIGKRSAEPHGTGVALHP